MNLPLRLFTGLAGLAAATVVLSALAHDFKLGAIKIGHPHARTTAPGQSTGGAYLRFENHGPADKLVGASSPVAAGIELHDTKMEGDVMQMRQVEAIAVPSNKAVELKPGGLHIMLTGLKKPLKKGESFPLTLKFEKAGEVTVQVNVEAPAAAAHEHKH